MRAKSIFDNILRRFEIKNLILNRKRALKLELTDGHHYIIAMERRPIPCLNTKLSPGTKILLIGRFVLNCKECV